MPILRVTSDIPRLEIPFYRGDTSVFRILLASDNGTITATAGSATVTVTNSNLLLAGMNLYTSNGVDIGTVATVGVGTATLTANATASYSGAYKVGIGWEDVVENAVCEITRFGSNQVVVSLELGDGITFDGDWAELDFTATDTQVRADKYQGDFRVLLADEETVQTLFQIVNAPFTMNRSVQP